ncbi:hypothetical protein JRQ81_019470 [Phrynocephalus forsythii]|uniref:Uncharacterized protein n=1 Tax=Phrynocephalus forsythii TaxID=171643 RepID=A0A9Q1AY07_9SAUR|nr:hypothetical protein JRQ81_019470 [Phrynocephalus forsythii]
MLYLISALEGERAGSSTQQQPVDLTSSRQSMTAQGGTAAMDPGAQGIPVRCQPVLIPLADQILDLSMTEREDVQLNQAVSLQTVASRCALEAPVAVLLVHRGGNDLTRAKGIGCNSEDH